MRTSDEDFKIMAMAQGIHTACCMTATLISGLAIEMSI